MEPTTAILVIALCFSNIIWKIAFDTANSNSNFWKNEYEKEKLNKQK